MILKNKYQQVQDLIYVTPEIEQRILDRVAQANQSKSGIRRYAPFRTSRKLVVSFTACLLIVICFVSVKPFILKEYTPTPPTLTTSPVIDYKGLSDLSEHLPFQLYVPSGLPQDYILDSSSILLEKTAQLIYSDGTDMIHFRMTKGEVVDSGDYNEYKQIETFSSDHGEFTIKGNNGFFSFITWSQNGYSFSISSSKPLSLKAMIGLATSVKPYSSH